MMALAGVWETLAFDNHPSSSLFNSNPEQDRWVSSFSSAYEQITLPLLLYQLPACRAFLVGIIDPSLAQQACWNCGHTILNKEHWIWFTGHVTVGFYVCACPVIRRDKLTAILFPVLRCGLTSGVTALRFVRQSHSAIQRRFICV